MKGIGNLLAFVLACALLVVVTIGIALIPLGVLLWVMLGGAASREEKALRLLTGTLMPGEALTAHRLQHRPFALIRRRLMLGITDSRVILIRRGLIGGFTMQDIQWKDLTDAKIEQNVWSSLCGSNLAFEHASPSVPRMAIDGIESDTAATIYSNAQFQEQAWEEKRRIRGMEETRAAAGGVVVHASPHSPAPLAATGGQAGNNMLEKIAKAKELLDMGAVSDAEFQEMKAKILSAA